MSNVQITDPLFRKLHALLTEEVENRAALLISGGALMLGGSTGIDPLSTAMKYQAQVSYIEALNFAIEAGLEIDRDQYGVRTKQNPFGDE